MNHAKLQALSLAPRMPICKRFSLPDPHYQDEQLLVFDFGDDPEITHTVFPKFAELLAHERFPDGARISQFLQLILKEGGDSFGDRLVELGEIFFLPVGKN